MTHDPEIISENMAISLPAWQPAVYSSHFDRLEMFVAPAEFPMGMGSQDPTGWPDGLDFLGDLTIFWDPKFG